MSTARRSAWPVLLASAIAFLLLCALGVWQVQRLGEKLALIADVESRMAAEPVSLDEALSRLENEGDGEYLHIRTTGKFLAGDGLRRIASLDGGPAFELLHPFASDEGIFVLVDRGTVHADDTDPAMAPPRDTMVTIDGLMRLHDRGQGLFDGENDPEGNLWVWWDVPAMIAAANPPQDLRVAPFILQLVPTASTPAKPFVAVPKAELRNNHLGYAITWFGLAAALLVITFFFAARRNRP